MDVETLKLTTVVGGGHVGSDMETVVVSVIVEVITVGGKLVTLAGGMEIVTVSVVVETMVGGN